MAATDDPCIAGPDQLSDDERAAVEALLFRLADDELVVAERYTDWQVRAPTVESDIAIANVAQDELGHARLWYDLLEDFGATEAELIFERDPADFRHATLVELPFEEGDWADAVVRSYCYDVAEYHRLLALEDTAYRPIATRVGKVLGEEDYHRDHAENWVERLASGEPGTPRVQAAVDRLVPYALALFEPVGGVEADIDDLGLRTESLADLRATWFAEVSAFLESVGLSVPEAVDEDGEVVDGALPEHVGRDGAHTDHWPELHDEMTHAYRDLGRHEPEEIMEDPEDD
jgi:ring-1,2-phenylacetyl-CoA epoxidase subunit PaaC